MLNIPSLQNNTANVVIQQNSRKLLMMDILMSETCWAYKKWNKISSDTKLVFYTSSLDLMVFFSHLELLLICLLGHSIFNLFLIIWFIIYSYFGFFSFFVDLDVHFLSGFISFEQTCTIYTTAVGTVINSWWWTEELIEIYVFDVQVTVHSDKFL